MSARSSPAYVKQRELDLDAWDHQHPSGCQACSSSQWGELIQVRMHNLKHSKVLCVWECIKDEHTEWYPGSSHWVCQPDGLSIGQGHLMISLHDMKCKVVLECSDAVHRARQAHPGYCSARTHRGPPFIRIGQGR